MFFTTGTNVASGTENSATVDETQPVTREKTMETGTTERNELIELVFVHQTLRRKQCFLAWLRATLVRTAAISLIH